VTDTLIQFLPDHLQVIPPAPSAPDDAEADIKRARYLQWRDDLYRYRVQRVWECSQYPDLIPIERYYCSQDFAYWLTIYGTIFEPRQDRNALGGGNLPFLPFAKQIDMMRWAEGCLTAKGPEADGIVSKTRDVGASWMFCAWALHGWLFKNPWNVLLISRREDLVDSKNHRSLFAKIDRMFWALPEWQRPVGYDPDKHRQKHFMLNPENRNELSGESTTSKAGRGDRVTWAAIDEAALVPDLLDIWNGIAATTGHRFGVSTEHLTEGPDFYNLRTGTDMEHRPSLFEIDWWDNPLNDDAYFEGEKVRYASRPADFEREILRNPHAGDSGWVYPTSWDPELEPNPLIDVLPMGATYISCDPGQLDETAIVVLQEDDATGTINVLDAYQNRGVDAPFYGTLLSATPDEERYPGMYGEREYAFMELLSRLPAPTYVGDTYGDSSNGVTMDTFYTVFATFKNPQGSPILFNRNRHNEKDKGMYMKSLTSFKGRRESLADYVRRLRFSDAPGAIFAHKCLKNNRFKPQDKPGLSEMKVPLHDWTSHVVTALEFWAVYKRSRSKLLQVAAQNRDKKPQHATLYTKKSSLIAPKHRATLYTGGR